MSWEDAVEWAYELRAELEQKERDCEALREACEAADALIVWLQDEWPAVVRDIPTPIYQRIRQAGRKVSDEEIKT